MQRSYPSDPLPVFRRDFSWLVVLLLAGGFSITAWLSVQQVNRQWDELNDHKAASALLVHPLWGSGIDGSQARLPMYVTVGGYALAGESVSVARLVGIIFGAATVVLTFYAGRRWFSNSVGLLAAGLLAVSPYFIGHSRFGLTESDAFCPFMVLLMLLVFDAYLRRRDSRYLVIFSLTLGLALAAKFYALLLVPALLICDWVDYRTRFKSEVAGKHRPMIVWVFSAALLIFLAGSAAQLKLVRLSIGLWLISVIIMTFGLRELIWPMGRGRWIIRRDTRWGIIWGWVVILVLAGTFCLSAFPEHVLQPEVARAFFRRLIRQDHLLPMARFIDPVRLYLGVILFKLGLPLGLLTVAGLIWAWIRSVGDSVIRLLVAVVMLYIVFLLVLPIRQVFYLMSIYPLLMLILAAFMVRITLVLGGRALGQSAWIALAATGFLWVLWGDIRVWPDFGFYGYEIVGSRWLGAESRGYRNLIQVTNDGTEDALAWCIENVPGGKRVVSYLWDDHVIDAFVGEHPVDFELVRRYPELDRREGPPFDDADYLIVGLNNQVSYSDAPPAERLSDYFDPSPIHMVIRGRGVYWMPVVNIYQRQGQRIEPDSRPLDSDSF
ncbi:MAG: glycosyltransferase family 39 protein [Planctomycetota bacterium]